MTFSKCISFSREQKYWSNVVPLRDPNRIGKRRDTIPISQMRMTGKAPNCCPFSSVNQACNPEASSYLMPLSPAQWLSDFPTCIFQKSNHYSGFKKEFLRQLWKKTYSAVIVLKMRFWEKQFQNYGEACPKYSKYGPS